MKFMKLSKTKFSSPISRHKQAREKIGEVQPITLLITQTRKTKNKQSQEVYCRYRSR